ncbi:multidrug efflux SMR transporter [Halosquirtibacter xylanolyticus]|uniref:DMT family transporter n=1 Tax=Halosquirtibacter xylanolyticus TaxID=3374599 RepID=UPI0037485F0C|nr:multidrug efflux SMR transporter [Prolixibacteraceae bacterium]
MSWLYLILAGVFEIGWPLGLKLSQSSDNKYLWILFAVASMGLSGYFLFNAQKVIPIGTAYAVWTGIGAVGTFIVGIVLFGDASSIARVLAVMLIVIGLIGLKLAH